MAEQAKGPLAEDWPTERIKAAIYAHGVSQAKLARDAGLSESSVRMAMISPHQPRAEAAVAELLGIPAHQIWPSRYWPDGRRRTVPRARRDNIGSPGRKQRQILEAV